MAEWRVLAETVLVTLQPVATTGTSDILLILSSAQAKLARWIQMAHWASIGYAVSGNDFHDPWPAGVCPTVALEAACRRLRDLCDVHAQAGNVFTLCRTRLGLVQGDPLWPVWEGHRAAALHHAARAREVLRSAASHAQAAMGASRFPPGPPAAPRGPQRL